MIERIKASTNFLQNVAYQKLELEKKIKQHNHCYSNLQ